MWTGGGRRADDGKPGRATIPVPLQGLYVRKMHGATDS
jgi:hypothetical protein